ncbi:MAG: single-stranded DNA-binding protein [Proteobacteria bacterium]|nr:single-stranded DNA-binding protein [Pseudomonadota bacterium]
MSVNKVILLGRLGADPEIRYSQSQMAICSMKIATNERRKGQDGQWADHTEWHNVVCFDKSAENCGKFLQKGSQVFIDGKIQTRKYQDQDGKDKYWTEIIANNVTFVGSKGKSDGMDIERAPSRPSAKQGDAGSDMNIPPLGETISFQDDDIPF